MKDIILFENILQTAIPDDFENMSSEMIDIMFPTERRPQVVMGSPDGDAYVAFRLIEKSLTDQQLFMASHGALAVLKKLFPSCQGQVVNVIMLEDSECGWFSFTARGMLNILFIIAIENKMILGTCGCSEDDYERLEEVKVAFLSAKSAKNNLAD